MLSVRWKLPPWTSIIRNPNRAIGDLLLAMIRFHPSFGAVAVRPVDLNQAFFGMPEWELC